MAVNTYETVFIVEPEISNEQIDQLTAKIKQIITDHKGTITSEDRWGRRRMAYPIQGHREGFYSVIIFTAEPSVVTGLEHFYNVTDDIIRHIVVRQIKKNKTFAPRRERPAGATESHRGYAGRSGGSRPRSDYAPSRPAAAPAPASSSAGPSTESSISNASPSTPPSGGTPS